MELSQVYNLINPTISEHLTAVDNPFIRQLAHLALEQAKQLKAVSFVLSNPANRRGEIAQKGIHSQDKSVLDITKLTPLLDRTNFRTLQEEIAYVRNSQLGMFEVINHPTWWKTNAEMLMVDYLLAASLCYIEIFDGANRVDKFFATRNRFIAGVLTGQSPNETAKYTNYLQTVPQNYELRQLKVLKITANKESFKVSQPRSHIDFSGQVKVTPLFLMASFVEGIQPFLNNGILRFRYLKDNLVEREFVTTLSTPLLVSTYGEDFAQKMILNSGVKLNRGYVRLPEFGISKFDASGVRALNLSRITQVEKVELNDVDLTMINVDMDNILPSITEGVYSQGSPAILKLVYEDLSGKPLPPVTTIHELRKVILDFIEVQHMLGTTTALRHMHKYMLARSQFFPNYRPYEKYSGTQQPFFSSFGVVEDEGAKPEGLSEAIPSELVGGIGGIGGIGVSPVAPMPTVKLNTEITGPKHDHTSGGMFDTPFNLGGE